MIKLSRRERLLAALSHAAILIPVIGFAISTIVWVLNRSRSVYIREQSLQALAFQVMQSIVLQLFLLIEGVVIIFIIQRLLENSVAVLLVKILFFPAVAMMLYIGLALVAAVSCVFGRNWRYPVFGKKLLEYINRDVSVVMQNEDRLVAGICHAGIFYPGYGMLIPGLVLVVKHAGNSVLLKFHAFQALVVQAGWFMISNIIVFIEILLALLLFTNLGPTFLSTVSADDFIRIVFAGSSLISVFFLLIVGPLLTVFASIAVVKLLNGNEYNYPYIGKLIHNRFYTELNLRTG